MRFGAAAAAALTALSVWVAAPSQPASALSCEWWDDICNSLLNAKGAEAQNQAQLQDIQNRIADSQQKMTALASLIRKLDGDVRDQQAAIDLTASQISVLDRKIRETEADIAGREAHLTVREQLLQQRVRSMAKHDGVSYLELVFTSTSFNQMVDRLVIMQAIVRSDNHLISDLRDERAAVARTRDDLAVQRKQRADLLARQQDQKSRLEATRASQQQAYDYQRVLEAQYESQRRELEREAAAIKAQIADLQKQYDAEASALGGGNGKFIWPIQSRNITQRFGCSDLLGEPYDPNCPTRHTHTGLDIGGDYGVPIYAGDSGVASSNCGGYGGGYGSYIVLIHGNGWSTFYAHLSGCVAQNGQAVRRGQVIGYEGSTGYSTGAHLHFEIRYNNVPQNPCAFLGC